MTDNKLPMPQAFAEAAAEWIVRRDGGELSPEDGRAFQAWLSDPAHRDAFDRLVAIWGVLDAERVPAVIPAPLPGLRNPVPRRVAAERKRNRGKRWFGAAIAASLALVVLGVVEDWPTRLRADHATGTGERRTVALEDGSTVELDSGSAIALHFSDARRRVSLLSGAAMFKVAPENGPDRARPFTVEALGGSVTALGTEFAVRAQEGRAEVVVTEHRVNVVGNGRSEVVGEGQRVDFGGRALGRVEPAGNGATAWTQGRLVVVDRPLGEVVSEIARYRRGYIGVSDAAAAIRVSGVYDLDRPVTAIDSIERSLNLASFRLSDRIIILHR